jgi:hypothetical protein
LRVGSFRSLSERDLAGMREFREFAKQEDEKQRLAEDQAEYAKYASIVDEEQKRVPRALKVSPIPFETWRNFTDQSVVDPVLRGAQATNAALLHKVRSDEAAETEAANKKARDAVAAGKRDDAFTMGEQTRKLRFPNIEAASAFAKAEAQAFLESTPAYYATKKNWETMRSYVEAQGVTVPDRYVFSLAFTRLSELGLLEPAPEPEPEAPPVDVQEPDPEEIKRQQRDRYRTAVVIIDPQTGQGYTEYQLDRLPADDYKRLMLGEHSTPTISDVIRPWQS